MRPKGLDPGGGLVRVDGDEPTMGDFRDDEKPERPGDHRSGMMSQPVMCALGDPRRWFPAPGATSIQMSALQQPDQQIEQRVCFALDSVA